MRVKLSKIRFGYSPQNPVLKDVGFSADEGEFIFLIGVNGSGKSTLLKIIAGFLHPQSGEAEIEGKNLNAYNHRELAELLAYVPQNYLPTFPYTVYEFVATGRTPYLNFYGKLKKRDKEIVERNLELIGAEKIANKEITKISGGEFRRVLIARALTQEPKILLLDEISAFLDIEHQISIFEFLSELNRNEKITIISVSHDLNLAGMFAQNIVLLSNGFAEKNPKEKILTTENIKKHFGVNSIVNKFDDSLNVTILRW